MSGTKAWKDYRISTLHYNWPTSVHASQAFSMSSGFLELEIISTVKTAMERWNGWLCLHNYVN